MPEPSATTGTEVDAALLTDILAVVREREGVDFSEYRAPTVARRVWNRMVALGAGTPADYLGRLRSDPAEAAHLAERLTIKVSRFFRNAPAVEAVHAALARRAGAGTWLTAWSAGCGRGEEAYALAMLLDDVGALDPASPSVLGTDLDPSALLAARAGIYPAAALDETPPAARLRWFEGPDARGRYRVAPALRRSVVLSRDDLGAPAPEGEPRFDLVACRNTLIYFTPPLQARVLARLRRALRPGGLLWLGESEWLVGEAAEGLEVVDRRARLFACEPGEGAGA